MHTSTGHKSKVHCLIKGESAKKLVTLEDRAGKEIQSAVGQEPYQYW